MLKSKLILGLGKCGVAVIRISGPCAADAVLRMTNSRQLPKPRKACLKKVIDPITKEHLDNGLLLWFPSNFDTCTYHILFLSTYFILGPKSFTGEDCCELQIHGGRAVVTSVLHSLSKIPDFRPADPGKVVTNNEYINTIDI